MIMNKLIKTCVIGGIVWASAETAFHYGKGYMLGMMYAYQGKVNPSDMLYILSTDKRMRSKFIAKIAEKEKQIYKRKHEL